MEGMSLIVKTVARWLKGFMLLFGAYLVVYGHLTPGGGFSGGVVIACVFILLVLAEGLKRESAYLSPRAASVLDCLGALGFLVVALLGLTNAGVFFRNLFETRAQQHFALLSAGSIPLSNISIGVKVGASLFLVFAALAAVRVARSRSTHDRGEGDT
jgi:multicomponent Na+:H+ antiporter subunit B